MANNNEKIERHDWERYLSAIDRFIEYELADKPDIHCEKDDLGVEHTIYYPVNGKKKSSHGSQESARKAVVEEAQKIYEEKKPKGVEVSFSFNEIKNRKGLAKRIAEWLCAYEAPLEGKLSLPESIPELKMVYVSPRSYKDPVWRYYQSYSREQINLDRLQQIIDSKELLFDRYTKYKKMWLLIVINFVDPGLDAEIENISFDTIKFEKFDKVILFRKVYDEIVEINRPN